MTSPLIIVCHACGTRLKLKDDRFAGAQLPCPKCRKLILVESSEQITTPVRTPPTQPVTSVVDRLGDLELDEAESAETMPPASRRKKSRSKRQRTGAGAILILGVLAGIILSVGGWLILGREQPRSEITQGSEPSHPGQEAGDVPHESMADAGKVQEAIKEDNPFVEIDAAAWLKWIPSDTQEITRIDYRLVRETSQKSKLLGAQMESFFRSNSAARVFDAQATLRDVDSIVMAAPGGVVTDSDKSSDNADSSYVLSVVTFHNPGLVSFDSQFPKQEYRSWTLFEIRKNPLVFASKIDDRTMISGPEVLVKASLDTNGAAPVSDRFAFVPTDHLMIRATSPRFPGTRWRRPRSSQFFSTIAMSDSITGVYDVMDYGEKQQTELGVFGNDMKVCEKACRQGIESYRIAALSKRDEVARMELSPRVKSSVETVARCVDQMARAAEYSQKNGVAIGRMITPDELLETVREMSGDSPSAEPPAKSVISPPPSIVIPSHPAGRAPVRPVPPGF